MQNLPNYFTSPNKMTSENDIKGLVSLKFLCPWIEPRTVAALALGYEHTTQLDLIHTLYILPFLPLYPLCLSVSLSPYPLINRHTLHLQWSHSPSLSLHIFLRAGIHGVRSSDRKIIYPFRFIGI
jgi:hypothetical protein